MAVTARLKKDLTKLIDTDSLAHGYILFGDVAAAGTLARGIGEYLERGAWSPDGKAPLLDFEIADARTNGSIGLSRRLAQFLWQQPLVSKRRTFVIEYAHTLSSLAQQAILKIAEEPPAHGLILFTATTPEALGAPLASRFQRLYCGSGALPVASERARTQVKEFLAMATAKERSEFLKVLIEDDASLDEFITALTLEFHHNPQKHWRVAKELATRWRLMHQYNLNKRLHIEAALSFLVR